MPADINIFYILKFVLISICNLRNKRLFKNTSDNVELKQYLLRMNFRGGLCKKYTHNTLYFEMIKCHQSNKAYKCNLNIIKLQDKIILRLDKNIFTHEFHSLKVDDKFIFLYNHHINYINFSMNEIVFITYTMKN